MTRRLNPRHRRTLLGNDLGRAAGFYEQCDHRSPTTHDPQHDPIEPSAGAHVGSLAAFGLVGRPRRLGRHVLRSLAGSDRLSDFDARTVSITDLLSEVRLDADAELIMWHGVHGEQIATPISRLFDDTGAELVLGGPDLIARPNWSEAVTLTCASLTNPGGMSVVALTAMTFSQFIGGRT